MGINWGKMGEIRAGEWWKLGGKMQENWGGKLEKKWGKRGKKVEKNRGKSWEKNRKNMGEKNWEEIAEKWGKIERGKKGKKLDFRGSSSPGGTNGEENGHFGKNSEKNGRKFRDFFLPFP